MKITQLTMQIRKLLTRLIFISMTIVIVSLIVWYLMRPESIAVELATINRGTVESIVVNTRAGTIKACRRANLAPTSGGKITQLWVKEGDRVTKGQALIECQEKKIKQLTELVENIKGEIELTKDPKEYNAKIVLSSIEALIDQTKEVEHIRGYFKWVG